MKSERDTFDDIYKDRRRLSDRYRPDIPGNRFNLERLRGTLKDFLNKADADPAGIKVLDLGCGGMFWAEEMIRLGVTRENCFGADILHWRMREGHAQGRDVQAINASAAGLPIRSDSFDLICQFTMMTSVPDADMRARIVDEIRRILKPGGHVLWYDFRYNNPSNPRTRAIGRAELRRLFPGWEISIRSATLVPPLARKTPKFLIPLLKFLYWLPMLRTHYVALIGPKG
jgi:SAM-dependent methyltransferase